MPYFRAIENEFSALGIKIEILQKNKTIKTNIESAFLNKIHQFLILMLKVKSK